MPDQPSSEPEQPEIKPLSRKASRLFVIIAAIVIIGGSIALARVLVENAQDPETQERLQEMQEREQSLEGNDLPAEPLDLDL